MTTLPAKTKTEEIKHRADFERMMMAAKEIERKKREEGRNANVGVKTNNARLGRWEKEILPSWSRPEKIQTDGNFGGKEHHRVFRGRIWALAIGNPLMLPRNLLEQSEKKAAGKEESP